MRVTAHRLETCSYLATSPSDTQHARPCSWTFKAYSNYFLEHRELKKEVAKTTLERQRGHFKAACMHIGEAKLEAITPAMLNSMYIALLKGESPSGRKVGGSYVNCIHDNIKLIGRAHV